MCPYNMCGQTFFSGSIPIVNPLKADTNNLRIELPTEEKQQKEQKLPAISIAITAKTMPESEMPSKKLLRRQRANERIKKRSKWLYAAAKAPEARLPGLKGYRS